MREFGVMNAPSNDEKTAEATIRITSRRYGIAEITDRLGVEPSRTSDGTTSGDQRWMLDSQLRDAQPIEDHVAHLLEILWQRRKSLVELAGECEIDIWCTLWTNTGFIGVVIDKKLIERASELGVELTFSFYAR